MTALRGSVLSLVVVGLVVVATGEHVALADDPVPTTEAAAPEPIVDLFSRVPRRWVSPEADELLIQSPRLLRRLPERCHSRGGYREHCSGPRRVVEPQGEALRLTQLLGLGHRATALQLRHGGAFDEWLERVEDQDRERGLHWPVPTGRLGREFGRSRQGELRHRRHLGVDIGAPEGTLIVAARGGLVVYSDNGLTGYGNSVMILHRGDLTTFYAHCSETMVSAGEYVERGEVIAKVGNTGFAENPHLHFEWREGGWARDPVDEFTNRR